MSLPPQLLQPNVLTAQLQLAENPHGRFHYLLPCPLRREEQIAVTVDGPDEALWPNDFSDVTLLFEKGRYVPKSTLHLEPSASRCLRRYHSVWAMLSCEPHHIPSKFIRAVPL